MSLIAEVRARRRVRPLLVTFETVAYTLSVRALQERVHSPSEFSYSLLSASFRDAVDSVHATAAWLVLSFSCVLRCHSVILLFSE